MGPTPKSHTVKESPTCQAMKVESPTFQTSTMKNKSPSTSEQAPTSVYSTMRAVSIFSKFLGAFPLHNTFARDGRELSFTWRNKVIVWDVLLFAGIVSAYIMTCVDFMASLSNPQLGELASTAGWFFLMCYVVAVRGTLQFVLLHLHAPRIPPLLAALENYHQGIGSPIVRDKREKSCWTTNLASMLWIVGVLLVLECASLMFFTNLDEQGMMLGATPVALSFVFANLWKELPMNMFAMMCMYLRARFEEVHEHVRTLREEIQARDLAEKNRCCDVAAGLSQFSIYALVETVQKPVDQGSDVLETAPAAHQVSELRIEENKHQVSIARRLAILRLQHAALRDVVAKLQSCYGLQLAVNMLFVLLDTVLQLFVFLVMTRGSNLYLLLLAVYYFTMSATLLAIVDRLQRSDDALLGEIHAFDTFFVSSEEKLQLEEFSAQIAARPILVSACGYFNVNNGVIASLLGAVATYLIVLVQLVPGLAPHRNLNISSLLPRPREEANFS